MQCIIRAMSSATNRMPLIDAFKAIASQLIVLHHLSAYGPLSITAQQMLPGTLCWLYDYARMAVQVFLVIGGFLAARALSGNGQALAGSPLALIWKRYLRLVVPYLAAIGLAIAGAAIADHWMNDEAIPNRATLAQWLAHVFLLQSLLGYDSLSAGVWYIAIDFQLFALWRSCSGLAGCATSHRPSSCSSPPARYSGSTATPPGTSGPCISSAPTGWVRLRGGPRSASNWRPGWALSPRLPSPP